MLKNECEVIMFKETLIQIQADLKQHAVEKLHPLSRTRDINLIQPKPKADPDEIKYFNLEEFQQNEPPQNIKKVNLSSCDGVRIGGKKS